MIYFILVKEQLFNAFFLVLAAITFPHAAVDNKNVSRWKNNWKKRCIKKPAIAGSVLVKS
jgi:hypothetical protein